jgi:hypothetical protein
MVMNSIAFNRSPGLVARFDILWILTGSAPGKEKLTGRKAIYTLTGQPSSQYIISNVRNSNK